MASVLRVRKVQEDIAAAARQHAELDAARAHAVAADRRSDLQRPWPERAVVELAFGAVGRAAVAAASADEVAALRREAHVAAVQRARAIERLVERRAIEDARDEQRRAAAILDDLATIRHRRGST
jgi:hypothetical protein